MDLPNSTSTIQTEATRFRSSVSEALAQQLGGAINYLLASILPVGSLIHAALTESQFQTLTSTGWILADGRNVSGSDYALVTGNSTVPDARGIYMRGKNNGRSTGTGDTSGEVGLGTYQADTFKAHTHTISATLLTDTGGDLATDDGSELARPTQTVTGSTGNPETRSRAIVTNIFIRIN